MEENNRGKRAETNPIDDYADINPVEFIQALFPDTELTLWQKLYIKTMWKFKGNNINMIKRRIK